MRCIVSVSLQAFSESKLSHHFHRKLSTISRNHGVIIIPCILLFSAHNTICNHNTRSHRKQTSTFWASDVKVSTVTIMFLHYSVLAMRTTHTHTHTQPFYGSLEIVRDNPGEPVPEETFTHYTHRGHQSSLAAFSIYYDTWHPPYSIHVLYRLFPQSL